MDPNVPSTDRPAIVTTALTKRYGKKVALDGLDLTVPRGVVFGFLGPNGAGKSTTIRCLMGLLTPSSGSGEVVGHDIVRAKRDVHRAVGYLPGDFVGYADLTAGSYLRHIAHLRGGVERAEIEMMAKRFDLDLEARIGSLSHGNRQKVGIIQAFMHRPEVLVLDEPTSGLDPLMQREFIDLLREVRDEGRTVFLSSHVLSEVEAVADLVAIIRQGTLVAVTDVARLRERTRRRVRLTFTPGVAPPVAALVEVPGVRELDSSDGAVDVTVEGSMASLFRAAAPYGIDRVVSNDVDLEGVFLQYYEEDEG